MKGIKYIMEELIKGLVEKFEHSLPNTDIKERLVAGFKKMLEDTEKLFRANGYDQVNIEKTLAKITEEWTNLDFEEKQRRLITDKSFGEIIKISNEVYNIAMSILAGRECEINFEISDKINQLENFLQTVNPYNAEIAKKYVSEGILDLKFIANPKTNVTSLRLGHIKENQEKLLINREDDKEEK